MSYVNTRSSKRSKNLLVTPNPNTMENHKRKYATIPLARVTYHQSWILSNAKSQFSQFPTACLEGVNEMMAPTNINPKTIRVAKNLIMMRQDDGGSGRLGLIPGSM